MLPDSATHPVNLISDEQLLLIIESEVHAQWTESRQSMSRPVITTKHLLCTNHLSKLKRHIGGALPID